MNHIIETRKKDKAALIDELTKAGAVFNGNTCRCPFHDDKRPSAGIFQTEDGAWRFKCQSCGHSADVWDVQAFNEGKTTKELLKSILGNSRKPHGKPAAPARVFKTIDEMKAACPGTVSDIYKYTNPDTGIIDMVVFRCQMPDGKTFRQGRPCSGGYEMKAPPKPWPIYNRTRIRAADTVVVVEGEKDVHSLNEYGITATTAPAGAGKASYADWTPLAGKNIVLWPDNDEPGMKHAEGVQAILEKLEPLPRVSIINPADLDLQEKEDATDYVQQTMAAGLDVRQALQEAIQRAKPKSVSSGLYQRLKDTIEGRYEVIEWPYRKLSALTNSLLPGTVTLLCGSPGASKSFAMLEAITHWIETGTKAAIYELEDDKEYHLNRILAQIAHLPDMTDTDWVKAHPEEALQAYEKHRERLDNIGRNIWICNDVEITLDQLAKWTDDRAKNGYRIICIDSVSLAAQTARPWEAEKVFLNSIKNTAKNTGCSIVLVTHPKQTVSNPDMNQLAGSAAYSRLAHTIVWLQAHEPKQSDIETGMGTLPDTHNRTLHILKSRNGKGQWVNIACNFLSENLTLQELGIIAKKK